jgi:hypothetical protein
MPVTPVTTFRTKSAAPPSVPPTRQNFAPVAFAREENIELDEADLDRIQSLDRHYRYISGDAFRTESGLYANIFDD